MTKEMGKNNERMRLGDCVHICSNISGDKSPKVWLLNLDMIQQQTGHIIAYNYVPIEDTNGSIVSFDTSVVLYSKLRPNLNKVVLPTKAGYATSELLPLKPNEDIVTREYLTLLLRSPKFVSYAVSKTAGAKMPRLSTKMLLNYSVSFPNISEQKRVATELDILTSLISLRRQQLEKLNQLAKSQFIEMFGDPIENPMGWPIVTLSNVIIGKASNGFFAKRDEYVPQGNASVIGVADVVNRLYSQTQSLPEVITNSESIKRYSVRYGDILFCRSSLVKAGIAKASIVPKNVKENTLYECHVIRLTLDQKKCIPEFLQIQTTTPFFRNQVIAQSKTATMTTISQDGIVNSKVILPSLPLQHQFAAFIEHLDKSKFAIEESIKKLELLYRSKLQEYFG